MKKELDYRVNNPGTSLMVLVFSFIICLVITGVLAMLLSRIMKNPIALLRISTIIQDLLIFVIPAFITAFLSTRLPATLLAVDKAPRLDVLLVSILVFLISVPAMNVVIDFNQNLHLPESMATAEAWFRNMESQGAAATEMLLSGNSVGTLLVSILIVGVLAGFSEELFFRGTMQRILMTTNLPVWSVIWIVAFIFSAFHMQFFGFLPRLLLGAYFGYLLYWTRCLWIPVIMHIFNNSLYIFGQWSGDNGEGAYAISTFGSDLSSPIEIIALCFSVLLTAAGILWLKSLTGKNNDFAPVKE